MKKMPKGPKRITRENETQAKGPPVAVALFYECQPLESAVIAPTVDSLMVWAVIEVCLSYDRPSALVSR